MKTMNALKRYGAKGTLGALLAAPVMAMAAVPTEVTEALTTAKTDATSVAGIVLGIIVALFAFALMRRALR